MNARNKLNAAAFNGAAVIGAVLGLLAQSWQVFLVVGLICVGSALISGDIRGPRRR